MTNVDDNNRITKKGKTLLKIWEKDYTSFQTSDPKNLSTMSLAINENINVCFTK